MKTGRARRGEQRKMANDIHNPPQSTIHCEHGERDHDDGRARMTWFDFVVFMIYCISCGYIDKSQILLNALLAASWARHI